MKVIRPGHRYELEYFEPQPEPMPNAQVLQFIEKMPDAGDPSRFVTTCNGTTNEEVLAMLIDRLKTLSAKLPSRETWLAITKCEEALMWLEKRTRDRKARGVDGTPRP